MTAENETNTKLNTVKSLVNTGVAVSVGYTIGSIIKNNTTVDTPSQKLRVVVGAYVIGAATQEVTGAYVNRQIDKIAAHVEKVKAAVKDAQNESTDPK